MKVIGQRKMDDVKLVLSRKAKTGQAAQYLVVRGENVIGLPEKYNDTRCEQHPWKAFRGIGMACTFIRSFYPCEGGKAAAVAAIV